MTVSIYTVIATIITLIAIENNEQVYSTFNCCVFFLLAFIDCN